MARLTNGLRFLVSIYLFNCSAHSLGQRFKIDLSESHTQKLSEVKSGHDRMAKYYQFVKKDSIAAQKKQLKETTRRLDSLRKSEKFNTKLIASLGSLGLNDAAQVAWADSIRRVYAANKELLNDPDESVRKNARSVIKKLSRDKVTRYLAQHDHPYKREMVERERLGKELKGWWSVMKDPGSSDSLRSIAKANVRELVIRQATSNPGLKGAMDQYRVNGQQLDWNTINGQYPSMDSLRVAFDDSPDLFAGSMEKYAAESLNASKDLAGFAAGSAELQSMKDKVGEFSSLEEMGSKVPDPDHFADKEQLLTAAQAKVGNLLAKYSEFSNSNDLSTAVKRTSLEGKTFKERLVLGGSFGFVSADPVSLDIAPLTGYRFNTKWMAGLSLSYRITFSDSLNYQAYMSPSNASGRAFTSYDLLKNFYGYAEYEAAAVKAQPEPAGSNWLSNYYLGIGKRMLIHPKFFITITAIYRLNNEAGNSSFPQRFQIRVGIQTSDLAFRKKKVYYNP